MCAKVVAFDYGERRLGVATGDTDLGVATGLPTIRFDGRRQLRERLQELVNDERPEQFVVGYPLNMDGTPGERCEAAVAFTGRLRGWFGRPVVLWDERLTSAQAERIRREAGVTGARARDEGLVDRASAVLILQSWFDSPDKTGIVPERGEEPEQ